MTGQRFRTDCPDVRRKLSQEHPKVDFHGFWISWKVTSTQHVFWRPQLPPDWSSVVLGCSLGPPGCSQNKTGNNKNQDSWASWNLQRASDKISMSSTLTHSPRSFRDIGNLCKFACQDADLTRYVSEAVDLVALPCHWFCSCRFGRSCTLDSF